MQHSLLGYVPAYCTLLIALGDLGATPPLTSLSQVEEEGRGEDRLKLPGSAIHRVEELDVLRYVIRYVIRYVYTYIRTSCSQFIRMVGTKHNISNSLLRRRLRPRIE